MRHAGGSRSAWWSSTRPPREKLTYTPAVVSRPACIKYRSLTVSGAKYRHCADRRLWAAEGYAEGTGVAMQIVSYGVPIRSVLAPWVALF